MADLSPKAFEVYLAGVRHPKTARRYRDSAEIFLKYLAARGIELATAPPSLLSDFTNYLVQHRQAPASVAVTMAGVKRYIDWRRLQGDRIAPPVKPDLPRIEHRLPKALTREQLISYLAQCEKAPDPTRMALLLMPYCGLRVTELLTVPLSKDAIRRHVTESGQERYTIYVHGKGGKIRGVPLLEPIYPRLRAYITGWRRRQQRVSVWLFPGSGRRGAINVRTMSGWVKWIGQQAGIRGGLTTHSLRRTYGALLWEQTQDINLVAAALGHESTTTTKRHYVALTGARLWSAIDRARQTRPREQQRGAST